MEAVSYTHLDVYKRQMHRIEKTGEFRMLFSELKSKEVVNLRDCRKMGHVTDFEFDECSGDVYKRQVHTSGGAARTAHERKRKAGSPE